MCFLERRKSHKKKIALRLISGCCVTYILFDRELSSSFFLTPRPISLIKFNVYTFVSSRHRVDNVHDVYGSSGKTRLHGVSKHIHNGC